MLCLHDRPSFHRTLKILRDRMARPGILRGISSNGRNGDDTFRIGIADGNGLIFVCEVGDDTLCQHVEWSSDEHVVCGGANNVNLEV